MEEEEVLKNFVKSGVFYAEINEMLQKALVNEGFSSCEIRFYETPIRVIIRAAKPHEVLGEKKVRLRQFQHLIAQRMGKLDTEIEINVEKVHEKALCPLIQANLIREKVLGGIQYKKAVNMVLSGAKRAGAQGCLVVLSGKLKGQRAKSTRFQEGLVIRSGDPVNYYIKSGHSTIQTKQGVIGVQVRIMLPHDPEGILGPSKLLPDKVIIHEPKEY
jgi:small subunit ribosomal protein S3e